MCTGSIKSVWKLQQESSQLLIRKDKIIFEIKDIRHLLKPEIQISSQLISLHLWWQIFVKSVLVASMGAAIIMEANKPSCSKFICNNWKVAINSKTLKNLKSKSKFGSCSSQLISLYLQLVDVGEICSCGVCGRWYHHGSKQVKKVAFCWFYVDTLLTYGFQSFRNAGQNKKHDLRPSDAL